MINSLKVLFAFVLIALFVPACTVTVEDNDPEPEVEISNQVAQGFVGENMPFTTETALVERTTLFNDEGYLFHLFDIDRDCTGQILGDVRFFLETPDVLTEGEYSGSGPFIGSTSFFGCDVIIEEVTDTTITGKVRGGNFTESGDMNIEGRFTATICM